MTPLEMEGLVIGPVIHRIDRERIDAFVLATGDDSARWVTAAPPGYAAAVLFAVAGTFLWDPRIAEYVRTLIHVDQRFAYPRPMLADGPLTITGRVARVRMRRGVYFVTFEAAADDGEGRVLDSTSTFLMSAEPAGAPGPDEGEPPAGRRGDHDLMTDRTWEAGTPAFSVRKSASRADLVRYAAASADFNPIHWDHDSARAAGFEGVVVHGLLMHAWLVQLAAARGEGDAPVAWIKARFREALRPAAPVRVVGEEERLDEEGARLALAVRSKEQTFVTATAVARPTP